MHLFLTMQDFIAVMNQNRLNFDAHVNGDVFEDEVGNRKKFSNGVNICAFKLEDTLGYGKRTRDGMFVL